MTNEAEKIFVAELYKLSPMAQDFARKLLAKFNAAKKTTKANLGNLPDEIWRDVVDFEGLYQVSNFGRVNSLRWAGGRIMKLKISDFGYPCLNLFKDGKKHFTAVHILVAKAFVPNPDGKPVVHHKDNNPVNPRADNLEWVTYSENEYLAFQSGRKKGMPGESNPCAKLSDDDARLILELYVEGDKNFGGRALAKRFGVSPATISDLVCGKTFKYISTESFRSCR